MSVEQMPPPSPTRSRPLPPLPLLFSCSSVGVNVHLSGEGQRAEWVPRLELGACGLDRPLRKGHVARVTVVGTGYFSVTIRSRELSSNLSKSLRHNTSSYANHVVDEVRYKLKKSTYHIEVSRTGKNRMQVVATPLVSKVTPTTAPAPVSSTSKKEIKLPSGLDPWVNFIVLFGDLRLKLQPTGEGKYEKGWRFHASHGINLILRSQLEMAAVHHNPCANVVTERPLQQGEAMELRVQPLCCESQSEIKVFLTYTEPVHLRLHNPKVYYSEKKSLEKLLTLVYAIRKFRGVLVMKVDSDTGNLEVEELNVDHWDGARPMSPSRLKQRVMRTVSLCQHGLDPKRPFYVCLELLRTSVQLLQKPRGAHSLLLDPLPDYALPLPGQQLQETSSVVVTRAEGPLEGQAEASSYVPPNDDYLTPIYAVRKPRDAENPPLPPPRFATTTPPPHSKARPDLNSEPSAYALTPSTPSVANSARLSRPQGPPRAVVPSLATGVHSSHASEKALSAQPNTFYSAPRNVQAPDLAQSAMRMTACGSCPRKQRAINPLCLGSTPSTSTDKEPVAKNRIPRSTSSSTASSSGRQKSLCPSLSHDCSPTDVFSPPPLAPRRRELYRDGGSGCSKASNSSTSSSAFAHNSLSTDSPVFRTSDSSPGSRGSPSAMSTTPSSTVSSLASLSLRSESDLTENAFGLASPGSSSSAVLVRRRRTPDTAVTRKCSRSPDMAGSYLSLPMYTSEEDETAGAVGSDVSSLLQIPTPSSGSSPSSSSSFSRSPRARDILDTVACVSKPNPERREIRVNAKNRFFPSRERAQAESCLSPRPFSPFSPLPSLDVERDGDFSTSLQFQSFYSSSYCPQSLLVKEDFSSSEDSTACCTRQRHFFSESSVAENLRPDACSGYVTMDDKLMSPMSSLSSAGPDTLKVSEVEDSLRAGAVSVDSALHPQTCTATKLHAAYLHPSQMLQSQNVAKSSDSFLNTSQDSGVSTSSSVAILDSRSSPYHLGSGIRSPYQFSRYCGTFGEENMTASHGISSQSEATKDRPDARLNVDQSKRPEYMVVDKSPCVVVFPQGSSNLSGQNQSNFSHNTSRCPLAEKTIPTLSKSLEISSFSGTGNESDKKLENDSSFQRRLAFKERRTQSETQWPQRSPHLRVCSIAENIDVEGVQRPTDKRDRQTPNDLSSCASPSRKLQRQCRIDCLCSRERQPSTSLCGSDLCCDGEKSPRLCDIDLIDFGNSNKGEGGENEGSKNTHSKESNGCCSNDLSKIRNGHEAPSRNKKVTANGGEKSLISSPEDPTINISDSVKHLTVTRRQKIVFDNMIDYDDSSDDDNHPSEQSDDATAPSLSIRKEPRYANGPEPDNVTQATVGHQASSEAKRKRGPPVLPRVRGKCDYSQDSKPEHSLQTSTQTLPSQLAAGSRSAQPGGGGVELSSGCEVYEHVPLPVSGRTWPKSLGCWALKKLRKGFPATVVDGAANKRMQNVTINGK